MSLQDDINLLNTLDEKSPGHLIRHDDWNSLVTVVTHIALAAKTLVDANLVNRVTTLETDVNSMKTTLANVEASLNQIESQITPLLNNYQVTMKTSKQHYALGELCEITVQVNNLQGQFVNPRPWVDFVGTWGKLKAAPGFTSGQLGEGGRSLSVQVNAQGMAKVLLSVNTSSVVTFNDELQVQAMLYSLSDDGQTTVVDAVMKAPTPGDARAKKGFKTLGREYEQTGSTAWRKYANDLYSKYGREGIIHAGEWDERLATVLAFARPDGDPVTPDGARGVASIQVSFRDWVSAWGHDYTIDRDRLTKELSDKLKRIVDTEVLKPLDKLLEVVKGDLINKSHWERAKYMRSAQEALDEIALTTNPGGQAVASQAAHAVAAQAASESLSVISSGTQQGVPVMSAHLATSKDTQKVSQQVEAVTQQVQQTQGLSQAVSVLEGRMQSTEQVGRSIQGSLQLINENVRGINALDETSLKGGVQKISAEIAAIKSGLRIG